MSYNILAINPGHNGSAALVSDGKLVRFIEEERLTRRKYDGNPFRAMFEIMYEYEIHELIIGGTGQEEHRLPWTGEDSYTAIVRKLFPNVKVTKRGNQHHLGHVYSAFYNSGFEKAIAIVVDGSGSFHKLSVSLNYEKTVEQEGYETESSWLFEFPREVELIHASIGNNRGNCGTFNTERFKISDSTNIVKSYEAVTNYLGFDYIDAGKTMGLSAYGEEDENIPPLFINKFSNKNIFNTNYPAGGFIEENSYPYLFRKKSPNRWHHNQKFLTDAEKNLAWKIQKETQELVGDYIEESVIKHGIKNIVISGGYGLNCVANYYYKKRFPMLNFYIDPISHDGGTAIGLAMDAWSMHAVQENIEFKPQKLSSVYLGIDRNNTLQDDVETFKDEYEIIDTTSEEVAKLISEKNIVCIFNGRAEAGPRALGNRSILYDPRDPNGKKVVNEVKGREWFRPFAGSVLKEYANEWFDMAGLEESPFMMYAVDVLKEKKDSIPCITHVDGTCRVQTVSEEDNEYFYDLISEFNKITNVPILFNTSFNLAGEPMVETFEDAIKSMKNSKLEYLYLPYCKLLLKVKK